MSEELNAAEAVAGTCNYICQNGLWTLTGGNAPPGFFCPTILGACTNPGKTLSMPPIPIPPDDEFTTDSTV